MSLYTRFLRQYILNNNRLPLLLGLLVMAGIASLLSFVTPAMSKMIIDSITNNPDVSLLNLLSLIAVVVLFATTGIGVVQNYLVNHFSQAITLKLRLNFFKHIQTLSWSFHDKFRSGELQYRMFNDVSLLAENAALFPINVFINLCFLVFANLVMFYINWKVAVFVNGILAVNTALYVLFQRKVEKYTWSLQKNAEEVYGVTQEQINRIKLSQLSSAQYTERRSIFGILRNLAKEVIRKNVFVANSGATISLVSGIWSIGILWVGGQTVIQKEITLGDLVGFLSLTGLMVPVTTGLVTTLIQYPIIRVSLTRFFEIMDQSPLVSDNPGAQNNIFERGQIEFKQVSFSYPRSERFSLNNLSFRIPESSITAITGPSGVGKSTLLKLIGRFYDCTEGSVEIDGIDLKRVKLQSLRRQIGYVGSYTMVFSGTVIENITYGATDKSFEDVVAAATLACIHDRIQELPDGYFTLIGSKGVELSDGEKQRIGLARCFLLKPRILLLDEATSNLDHATENKIMQNLWGLRTKSTIVLVSHRTEAVQHANLIINLPPAERRLMYG